MFIGVDHWFDLVINNAENTTTHKHIEQHSGRMFGAISEVVGNSVLIPNHSGHLLITSHSTH